MEWVLQVIIIIYSEYYISLEFVCYVKKQEMKELQTFHISDIFQRIII